MGLSPGVLYKIGSGLVATGSAFFGGRSIKQPNTQPVQMPGTSFTANPYMYNPYETNPMEGAWGMQQQAIDEEALALEQQGQIQADEAHIEALQKSREAVKFREGQAMDYLSSGVTLSGSPMMVLEETRRLAEEEVNAIEKRGAAIQELMNRRALITRLQGRASLFGEKMGFETAKNKFEADKAAWETQNKYTQDVAASFRTPTVRTNPVTSSAFSNALGELGALTDLFSGSWKNPFSSGPRTVPPPPDPRVFDPNHQAAPTTMHRNPPHQWALPINRKLP